MSRTLARKLLVLPALVAALLVAVVPASAAGPQSDNPGNGTSAVDGHKPYGVGDGRKFK